MESNENYLIKIFEIENTYRKMVSFFTFIYFICTEESKYGIIVSDKMPEDEGS